MPTSDPSKLEKWGMVFCDKCGCYYSRGCPNEDHPGYRLPPPPLPPTIPPPPSYPELQEDLPGPWWGIYPP